VYQLIIPAAGSPVDLATLKLHLRLALDPASAAAYVAEDIVLAGALASATRLIRDVTRPLLVETWQASFAAPDTANGLTLEAGPNLVVSLIEVLQSGVYVAVAPTIFNLRPASELRAHIRLAQGQSWPTPDVDDAAFRVTFTMGYATAAAVPAPLASAILITAAGLYEGRDEYAPANTAQNPAVGRLIAPYRAPMA
jgi:uncharacterized phiE125 gp8 family phage protein